MAVVPAFHLASAAVWVYKQVMLSSSTDNVRPRRVLVVEDREDDLVTTVELLELLGCEVRGARNGSDAIALAQQYAPHVVLLDIGMPVMSGHDVALALRADPRTCDALIVAVTGYGSNRDRELSLDAGFDLHLVKPVPVDRLIELLGARELTQPQRNGQTVLVVNDNSACRYATARGLTNLGFNVIESETGSEALAMAGEATAVVLDVVLPDMDGIEVCRRLRTRYSAASLPIVHLSALRATDADAQAGRRAGANAYMVSPVSARSLGRVLDSLLAARA
jgi:CheY-like chemotaxis protein